MNIGILTFYKVANFGANLQAVSTCNYLKKEGHNPIFLNYVSSISEARLAEDYKESAQTKAHIDFVNKYIADQTENLYTSEDVLTAIEKYHIEAVIIGSDAVVQHHPLLSRIHKGRRKPFFISHLVPERMFPNPFWGIGFNEIVPTAMMSVSSQNSRYSQFSKKIRMKMLETLSHMKYISVRDSWTEKMMTAIGVSHKISVTPDPVFAFNYNAGDLVPSVGDIRNRFTLPDNYVLICLHSQSLSETVLSELKQLFKEKGIECVAFPMPGGIKFRHNFDYEINVPLSPIDWYALIKNSSGYIGSNMHPVIVSLHNAVPCFSIDHWGTKDFFNRTVKDSSSKVEHILGVFGLKENIKPIEKGKCEVDAYELFETIESFPIEKVREKAEEMYCDYEVMMKKLLDSINTSF